MKPKATITQRTELQKGQNDNFIQHSALFTAPADMEVIMKTTKKRYFSALLSMTLLLPCLLAPTATAEQDFYPDATYDAAATSEKDDSGKWKYRNLFPEEGQESTNSSQAGAVLNNGATAAAGHGDAHTGTYSWQETLTKEQCIRINIDPVYVSDYRLSMWLKTENVTDTSQNTDTDRRQVKVTMNGHFQNGNGYTNLEPEILSPKFSSRAKWEYFAQNVTVDNNTALDKRCTLKIKNPENYTVKLSADDWSFRRIPAEGECVAYTKSATTAEKLITTADEVCFTFSNDIDPYTVTKENVLLNGVAYDDTKISWTVNETTRENKLSIKFGVLSPESTYTVELSGITDAWGRAIVGTNKTTIKTLPAVERTSLSFQGENGEMSSLSAGELTVSLRLKSNVGNVSANIIAAECDGNKIVEIVSVPATLTATETDFTLPKMNVDSADHSVRVFVWSDGDYPVQYTGYGTFSSTGWKDAEY